jgi:DNA-binding CsgD family transcriptional regulator
MAIFDRHFVTDQWFMQRAIAISIVVFLLIAIDIISDYHDGVAWGHLLTELVTLSLSALSFIYASWLYYHMAQAKISGLTQDLALATQQAQQWRTENQTLIAGLALQIQKQFDGWQLTPAEAEVAMLMLKGLSHSEIAHVRYTSERTIRDQACAIYRKAGVYGRSGLAAFFLEDLLLPPG